VIRLRARYARRSDDGVAMLFVIAISLVVTGLVIAMFSTVLQTSKTAKTQRNITSAQAAAEAGVNDAVFNLSQIANGVSNWTLHGPSGSDPWTEAHPFVQQGAAFGDNASYKVWLTPMTGSSNYILWAKGTYGTDTRTIRAQIAQGSPPAFDFSMFASKGIDIHHHNSSWLSPQVWTTSVHSNGYINVDYSAEFTVNSMEAVGNLLLAKSGGSTPGGTIPSTGYNWYDALNNKCFPGGMENPGGIDPSGTATCGGPKYSPNAVVYGTVRAGSVTINSHGQVLPATAGALDTGQQINPQDGDVLAGSATIGGTTYTTQQQANGCTACNKGPNTAAGQISGKLSIGAGNIPPTIPFPSFDYTSNPYKSLAQAEQLQSGQTHIFTSSGTFLNYITDPAHGFYYTLDGANKLQPLSASPAGTAPDVIFLDGDWDITGGSATLNYNTIAGLVHSATGTSGPAPLILIRGSLIVEGGGIKLNTGLVMVGTGNNVDFLRKGNATTPITVNTQRNSTGLLDPAATMPAVLAAGGSIDSSDYDTDSNWTSAASYEPAKATPTYIRGLVYSASWNATTKTSVPESQHWHNFDPKNLQKIYGAQVGAQLHDCNNFSFSYDPLVKNAFGFSSGTVTVVDYQELGT
jgi:hypothetical protein